MSDINLNAMSLPELKHLQKAIAKTIAAYSDRKKREALLVLEARAQEFGFSLADLMGGKLAGKKAVRCEVHDLVIGQHATGG